MTNISLRQALAGALLTLAAQQACAVVIRHDVDDSRYRVPDSAFPALADIPCEAHGVLIAPQWVLTAAHAITWQSEPVHEIMLNGRMRRVEKNIVHSGYRVPPPIPEKGDAAPFMRLFFERDDIALLKLAEPVTDVAPVPLYRGSDEKDKLMTFFGKGATGDGLHGQSMHAPHRTVLRQGYNVIASTEGKWLGTVFTPEIHPLAAKSGSGDSGGPVLIQQDGQWRLAGLTSFDFNGGDISTFKPGIYGMRSYAVRVSAYVPWIEQTIAANK